MKTGTSSCCTYNSKSSPGKLTLTVVKMQQLPDIEKTDSKEQILCLKWTIYNDRRKVCVNFQTDTDKVNFAVKQFIPQR